MSQTVIRVDQLSKRYQLGTIGYGSLQHDLKAWWARARGKEDPNAVIGTKSRLDRHGDFWALQDINFEVNQGDRVGIVGRNGAGKSTLLKVLSRITSPTHGSIRVRGRIASLLEVGTGFHPELTGRENVFLNGAILGMRRKEIQSKFDEIVAFAGVEQFIDTPVKRYSSGMYVRLAFSVAAHLDSEILIIDEVLAVGDAEFQRKCLGKMEGISKAEGRTILFVSHNISAIKRLCNQGLYLKNGRLVDSGDSKGIIEQYIADAAPDASGDLSSRLDRQGEQRVVLRRVWLETPTGTEVSQIQTGDPLRLRYELENRGAQATDLHVSFTFVSEDGVDLVNLSNYFEGMKLGIGPSQTRRYECRCPEFPLNEGKYTINAYVSDGITVQDWISSVGTVSIHFNDFFGSGQRPGSTWPVLLRSEWH